METIFIQIATYRDPNLLATVNTAWKLAKHPERLKFSICLQEEENELAKFVDKVAVPKDHIHVTFVNWKKTKGLCWARRLTQKVRGNEDYDLMIDSHMRFTKGWDTRTIEEYRNCESNKAILTAYCPNWSGETKKTMNLQVPFTMQPYAFGGDFDDMLYFSGSRATHLDKKPVPHACISCHFLFTVPQFYKECPYDPHSSFGYEECALAVRGWTHGWDFFAPTKILVRHTWERYIRKLSWEDDWETSSRLINRGMVRWRKLVGMKPNPKKFGDYDLGKARTLEEYELFAGVSFRHKTLTDMAKAGFVLTQWLTEL